jgi:hypothetical protein
MGYRSDVAFCFKRPPQLVIPMSIDNFAKDLPWDDIIDNGDSMLFSISSIKWYEGYEVIANVMKFLKSLEYDDYLFIRLGEDSNDNETEGGWYDNPFDLGTLREITFSNPKTP